MILGEKTDVIALVDNTHNAKANIFAVIDYCKLTIKHKVGTVSSKPRHQHVFCTKISKMFIFTVVKLVYHNCIISGFAFL